MPFGLVYEIETLTEKLNINYEQVLQLNDKFATFVLLGISEREAANARFQKIITEKK